MSITPSAWQPLLTTARLGRPAPIYARELASTNALLKQLAREGAAHGTVCLCETQSAGRGRFDRVWSSPEGRGVWMSVLLRPRLTLQDAPLITFCCALAMAQAIREEAGLTAQVKWPNDLVIAGRKVCGILLETSLAADGSWAVIAGMGLNVHAGAYPQELAGRAAALDEFGPAPGRERLVAACLNHLEALLARVEAGSFAAIREDYSAASVTLGSRVQVSGRSGDDDGASLTGVAIGVDETGALLVRTDDGAVHTVLAGDVSVRGVMGYV